MMDTDVEDAGDDELAEIDRLCVAYEVYLWRGFRPLKDQWARIRHEMYRRGLKPLGTELV